jgi:myosin heavy subunit
MTDLSDRQVAIEDMISIPNLTEESLMRNLEERFNHELIYVKYARLVSSYQFRLTLGLFLYL